MCLALPALVLALQGEAEALVELGGVKKTVSVQMTPEARPGDYVIVHVGHAIGMVDADEAAKTLALFAEIGAMPSHDGAVEPASGTPLRP